ncbi:MAG: exopolyphosphatase [Bacteroidetes bacterium]|nr:exopolyphosphatase [Bacteroidota bacterium]
MLKIEKYGAVDIGSNAIRLLIVSVIEQADKKPIFKKVSLIRVPIRLGEDVFSNGKISQNNISRMIDAMNAFRLLIKTHNIEHYRTCATSAMREATNKDAVVEKVKEHSLMDIEIIDGQEEADIIASTDLKNLIEDNRVFLYVDVGGGSTELTLYENGMKIASKSLELGTVRLMKTSKDALWDEMKKWIKRNSRNHNNIAVIGSGGNINTIYKLSGKKIGKPLNYAYLLKYHNYLKSLSFEERIVQLGMNPDRADVVVPASKIYLSAMKWSASKYIYVPKIGLSDGIIRSLYYNKQER